MTAVPEDAELQKALRSSEVAALALARVELCHFLAEMRRVLGAEGPERFLRSYFGDEALSLSARGIDRSAAKPALQSMPLVEGLSDKALRALPLFDAWKWWALYARWKLFVGPRPVAAEDMIRYRRIVGNRAVLRDAGIDDDAIDAGAYRFQVDFDPDDEWIDEKALCLLCGLSEQAVAALCARIEDQTAKADYSRTVIRVGAVRDQLAASPTFVATTFLDPDDERINTSHT